jgi:hypothetical protein
LTFSVLGFRKPIRINPFSPFSSSTPQPVIPNEREGSQRDRSSPQSMRLTTNSTSRVLNFSLPVIQKVLRLFARTAQMSTLGPNLVFQETVNGARRFELLEAPFQKDFAGIAKLALFTSGKFFKVRAQSLTDPQADLYFPFAHWLPSYARGKCAASCACIAFRWGVESRRGTIYRARSYHGRTLRTSDIKTGIINEPILRGLRGK